MASVSVEEKLSATLFKFTTAEYSISSFDEASVQKLLSWFTTTDNVISDLANHLLDLPVCIEWLKNALKLWEFMPPHFTVAAFTFQFTGIVGSDPRRFEKLQSDLLVDKLCESLRTIISGNVTVQLAYVDMLSKFLKHDTGCRWIMDTGVWKYVTEFCIYTPNIYLLRESQKFAADLMVKVQGAEDWGACEKILHHVLGPVVVKFKFYIQNGKNVCNGYKFKDADEKMQTIAAFTLACHMLEASLSGTCTIVSQLILQKYNLEAIMWQTLLTAEEEGSMGRVSKFLVLIYFVSLGKSDSEDEEVLVAAGRTFKKKIFQVLSFLLSKKSITNILKVCSQCHVYFQKFNITASKFEKNSRLYEVEDQILCLHILPILASLESTKSTDTFMDSFVMKILDMSCEETIRLAYPYRAYLMEQRHLYQKHTLQAITSLMRIKNYLERDRGIIVFQAIMYSLKDFVPGYPNEHRNVNREKVKQHSQLLSTIVESLAALITQFNISWRESVESICLNNFAIQLLKNPFFPSSLTVSTLRLVQAAIQNYMTPTLALLINSTDGSSTMEVCPLISQHLEDLINWEVRDSALELLQIVTDISKIKFTAFQDHVMENNLCSKALNLSLEDDESYVRASALRCVCTMVKVPRYWTDSFSVLNVPEKMIKVLKTESEGIVRREAALIIKELFELKKIPKSLESEIYEMMESAATSDLHWEVRVNALCFWEKVIGELLSNQGMIDGEFPNVTFSKEKHKIVTLTEEEVKLRLNKVLDELARLRCLTVLLSGIHDCDLEVVRKTIKVVSCLLRILSRYGMFPVEIDKTESPLVSSVQNQLLPLEKSNDVSSPQKPKKKRVVDPTVAIIPLEYRPEVTFSQTASDTIESLLDNSDLELVNELSCERMSIVEETKVRKAEAVSRTDFLKSVSEIDLDSLVDEKSQWLYNSTDNLSSILDDILRFTYKSDHNTIDCY